MPDESQPASAADLLVLPEGRAVGRRWLTHMTNADLTDSSFSFVAVIIALQLVQEVYFGSLDLLRPSLTCPPLTTTAFLVALGCNNLRRLEEKLG